MFWLPCRQDTAPTIAGMYIPLAVPIIRAQRPIFIDSLGRCALPSRRRMRLSRRRMRLL
jgi:hypothetical protein